MKIKKIIAMLLTVVMIISPANVYAVEKNNSTETNSEIIDEFVVDEYEQQVEKVSITNNEETEDRITVTFIDILKDEIITQVDVEKTTEGFCLSIPVVDIEKKDSCYYEYFNENGEKLIFDVEVKDNKETKLLDVCYTGYFEKNTNVYVEYTDKECLPEELVSQSKLVSSQLVDEKEREGIALAASVSNAEYIYDYFTSRGYSSVATCAMIGNIMWESGSGGSFDIPLHVTEAGSGAGIGMVQWTGGRRTNFEEYCSSQGVSWKNSTIEMQCAFLNKELNGHYGTIWVFPSNVYSSSLAKYKMSLSAFKSSTDLSLATGAFCFCFERPSESKAGLSTRQTYAQKAYNAFGGNHIVNDLHTVDQRYPASIKAYPLATSGTISVYTTEGNVESNRYIDYNDECTIKAVYTDGWCLVTYPTGSGTRDAYVKKNVFFAGDSIINTSWSPQSNTSAYRRSNKKEAYGSVWTTDKCKVVVQSGSMLQVIFPLDVGGYKLGWIENVTTVVPDEPRPGENIPGPIASGVFSGKTIVAVAPQKITMSSSAYIDRGDVCKIYNVNSSTGMCTVDYPSGSTNVFTASKVKTTTISFDNFINYNGNYASETTNIPEKTTAYPTSEMTATVASTTTNWYLDPGDTFTTINKIGNATEVLYYCTTGAHSGMWKLGWIYLNYDYFDVNGYIDGVTTGTLDSAGTVDVYINGTLRANDVSDFYQAYPRGSKYEVKDIRPYSGYSYNGIRSGTLSGTLYGETAVVLDFTKDAAKCTGMSVKKNPSKVEYLEGEALDTSGLEISLNYDDGTSKNVTNSCTISGFDSSPGIKTVKVTYGLYETAFTVKVNKKSPISMKVTSMPNKTKYEIDEALNLDGLVVTVTYDNGTTQITEEYEVNSNELVTNTPGEKTLQLLYTYNDVTVQTSFKIRVLEALATPMLTAGNVSVDSGSDFIIPLRLSNNPGIASLKLKVSYDESIMTLKKVSYNSEWRGSSQQPQYLTSPIILNWYNGAENYTGNDTFVTLSFASKPNLQQITKSCLQISFNEDDIYNIDERNLGLDFNVGTITINPVVQETEQIIASGVCGTAVKWTLNDQGLLVVNGTGTMKNYEYMKEVPWYSYMDRIVSVKIESGVTSVGAFAFYGLKNCKKIELPDGLKSIGDYAFKNSTALTTVKLPTTLTKLGESAFYGCDALTSITIPEGIYTIWAYTFKNCINLSAVTLPSTLVKIDEAAFYGCSSLTGINIPSSVNIIGEYCFKNCVRLKNLTLSPNITQIREAAFYATAIETLEIPSGVTIVGPYAFKKCGSLVTIQFPNTVTSIGDSAFYGSSMRTLTLPDSVTKIGSYAFKGCEMLESVKFPANLVTIGDSAFYYCTQLERVILPEGLTTIEGYAFKNCSGLMYVDLPDSLRTIGDSAFYSCTELDTITIPGSVTRIGEYCFSRDTGLKEIIFEGNAPTIGEGAFSKVNAYVYIPEGNTSWNANNKFNYGGSIIWRTN